MAAKEKKDRRIGEIPEREYAKNRAGYYTGRIARWTANAALKVVGGVTLLRIAGGGIMDASDQAINLPSIPLVFGYEVTVGFGDREKIFPELLEEKGMLPEDRDFIGVLVFDVRKTGLERGRDVFTATPIASPAPQT